MSSAVCVLIDHASLERWRGNLGVRSIEVKLDGNRVAYEEQPCDEELPVAETGVETDGTVVTGAVKYPDPTDPIWASDWAADHSAMTSATMKPDTIGGQRMAAAPTTTAAASGRCSRGSFRTLSGNPVWDGGDYSYTINTANLPGGSDKTRVRSRTRLVDGHRTWNRTLDSCKNGKHDSFHANFAGLSSHSIADHKDSHNVVGFSPGKIVDRDCPFPGNVLACTVTRKQRRGGPDKMLEADTSFDGRDRWWNKRKISSCSRRFDIWQVSTHEVGHTLGLDHNTSGPSVMQPGSGYCDNVNRILAQRDVQAVRALY
jgi:hypothetical protein